MAYTTVDKASANMNAVTYTGNSSVRTISGVGFQPDFVWIKDRGNTGRNNMVFDALRGATKHIHTNDSDAEATLADTLTAFTSDGFSLGADSTAGSALVNGNSNSYISWNFKANGAGSANSDGSITTTSTSANTASGFSIVKFTATGSAATIGHGLGVAPAMIWVKRTSSTADWQVYHKDLGATKYLELSQTQAVGTSSGRFNDTAPTSTVFSIGNEWNNGSELIAYCFAEKPGFSKAYTYTANGSQPRFIHCNFKPIWWIGKASSNGSESWTSYDNKREGYNPQNDRLFPNNDNVEGNETLIDLVSNGIVIRDTSNGHLNYSNYTYVGMAFGQSIVGSNKVPATAR
tara:strand:+ start:721 stop:1761 length:1041 start_codon:yes stop_codon:yes gene_type:complete